MGLLGFVRNQKALFVSVSQAFFIAKTNRMQFVLFGTQNRTGLDPIWQPHGGSSF
jgi:hypothetical protein